MNSGSDTHGFQTLESVARQRRHSENVAPSAIAGNFAMQPLRSCLGQCSRVSTSSSSDAACHAPSQMMPLSGVLGDISNMVGAGRAVGKLPKAFGFLQPQAPPPLGAPPGPAPVLSSAGPHMVRVAPVAPPQAMLRDDPYSAMFGRDTSDPQRASEYAPDIFARLLETESIYLPKPDYVEGQSDINGKMRAILIDWLVEVHMKYRLRPETLFLTVNIIDRYLSVRPMSRNKLQLLGVVAMLIASKYEEIDPPKVKEFAYITDHTYSKQEILDMEVKVLIALEYQIAVPTPVHLLDRLQRANGCDEVHCSFVQYALELAMMDMRNLRYPPSMLVSAALLMSNEYLGRQQVWPAAIAHHTRRSEKSVRACAADLRVVLETAKTASLQAVRRKYQLDLFHAVANLRPVA